MSTAAVATRGMRTLMERRRPSNSGPKEILIIRKATLLEDRVLPTGFRGLGCWQRLKKRAARDEDQPPNNCAEAKQPSKVKLIVSASCSEVERVQARSRTTT